MLEAGLFVSLDGRCYLTSETLTGESIQTLWSRFLITHVNNKLFWTLKEPYLRFSWCTGQSAQQCQYFHSHCRSTLQEKGEGRTGYNCSPAWGQRDTQSQSLRLLWTVSRKLSWWPTVIRILLSFNTPFSQHTLSTPDWKHPASFSAEQVQTAHQYLLKSRHMLNFQDVFISPYNYYSSLIILLNSKGKWKEER